MAKTITTAWRESTTFKLVLSSWGAVFFKYLSAGLDFGFGAIPPMSVGEFAAAVAAILAVWLGREWRASHYANKD